MQFVHISFWKFSYEGVALKYKCKESLSTILGPLFKHLQFLKYDHFLQKDAELCMRCSYKPIQQ